MHINVENNEVFFPLYALIKNIHHPFWNMLMLFCLLNGRAEMNIWMVFFSCQEKNEYDRYVARKRERASNKKVLLISGLTTFP